jgi:protein-arginine deiminase
MGSMRHPVRFLLIGLMALGVALIVGHQRRQVNLPQATAEDLRQVTLPSVVELVQLDPELLIFGDTNRDGQVTRADVEGRHHWAWTTGALMLANVDDDNQDGLPDWQDEGVNGPEDAQDLAQIKVSIPAQWAQSGYQVYLEADDRSQSFIQVFQESDGFEPVDISAQVPLATAETLDLAVEAKHFAHQNWNGLTRLEVTVQAPDGAVVGQDYLQLRVTPWLMLPNTAQTTDVFISAGAYENGAMRSQLQQHLAAHDIALHEYQTDAWQEMWMQDTMEIGYQEIPGHPLMHVVLRANRGLDRFPATLLGPGIGYLTVGQPRHLSGPDELADGLGNLQVSPPVPGYPLGRIYYGTNPETGITLHPEMVTFVEMQQVQSPVSVDTSWLSVKHVDEIFNFLPGPDDQPYLIMTSAEAGANLVQTLTRDGYAGALGYPSVSVQAATGYVSANLTLQQDRLNAIQAKAQQDFHLDASHIIAIPTFYSSAQDASSLWSNPINSVYIDGSLILGHPWGPEPNPDPIQDAIAEQLTSLNIDLVFVDDRPYQVNRGNVHCATNRRQWPEVDQPWQYYPASA